MTHDLQTQTFQLVSPSLCLPTLVSVVALWAGGSLQGWTSSSPLEFEASVVRPFNGALLPEILPHGSAPAPGLAPGPADRSCEDLPELPLNLRGLSLVGRDLRGETLELDRIYGADMRHALVEPDHPLFAHTLNAPGRITRVQEDGVWVDLKDRYAWASYEGVYRRATQGQAFDQFVAAYLLETYGTLDEDCSLARTFYEQAAAQDYWPAVNNLGWMYERGYGVDQDLIKAYDLYHKAFHYHDVAAYNVTRYQAIYRHDREAFYSLGDKYKSGTGAPMDMTLAHYWMRQAADQGHPKACRYVGMMYRNGVGTPRDLTLSFHYLQKGATPSAATGLGDTAAQYELGRAYERGWGVPKDYELARVWYEAACRADDTGALMHLGKLYEEGKGGPVSYTKALACYDKVARQGRVSGHYHKGRMLEHMEGEKAAQEAVKAYEFVLAQDPTHTGALFLLGTHYQRGWGINQDLPRAEVLYRQAMEGGHQVARLRHKLMEQGRAHDTLSIHDLTIHHGLLEAMDARGAQRDAYIQQELAHHRRIGGIGGHDLTQDYEACRRVLRDAQEREQDQGCRIYWDRLTFDPYVLDYSFLEPVSPEESSPEALTVLFHTLQEAAQHNPALTSDLIQGLSRVLFNLSPSSRQGAREQFVRLYKAWVSDETGLPVPPDTPDPLRYRQGLVAQKLSQNIERCGDGLSVFLSEEEMTFGVRPLQDNPFQREIPEVPLGLRLSLLMTQYKKDFLAQHQIASPLTQEEIETNTESAVLLFQRLRLPLGLPGAFVDPLYVAMGQGHNPLYQPSSVMTRLVEGGVLDFGYDRRVTLLPLTVEGLCTYIKDKVEDPDTTVLTLDHLSDFVLRDPILTRAGRQAFIDFEENAYSNPFVDAGANPYKIKTFERLLALHGYILGHDPGVLESLEDDADSHQINVTSEERALGQQGRQNQSLPPGHAQGAPQQAPRPDTGCRLS